ncbi:S9 family peptidase [Marinibactrum halimedae]|uniref:Peptidase S9 n=1 Tax=Marinibactrum halimedae TaxID=1444977 RepID=A0AA37TDF7_9GAMM|nr:S9 family peptidase [Marinibactrum halimedae]MCD9458864.1 S9 family peptidase [Marinibactrum halimedae]GLS27715.1 peptidase S9 [Marinibactrum halimedae]
MILTQYFGKNAKRRSEKNSDNNPKKFYLHEISYLHRARGLCLGFLASLSLYGCVESQQPVEFNAKESKKDIVNHFLNELPNSPSAKQKPFDFTHHGITVSDPWNWLRDPDYPNTDDEDVLAYLKAENAYFHQWLEDYTPLKNTLFKEFKGRLDETETSVPWVNNGYEYKWEYRDGEEYKTYLRKPLGKDDSAYRVFLDAPQLAKGIDYFDLGGFDISPDNQFLAYSVNTDGSERYTVHLIDLNSGKTLPDTVENTSGQLLFTQGNALVYGALETEKWRVESINVHYLGTPSEKDKVLLAESDDGFFLGFESTSDDEYLIIGSGQAEISEYYVVPQSDLSVKPLLLASRERGFNYELDHAHGKFWIVANDKHVNFRIASVEDNAPQYENWKTVVEGSDKTYIKSVQTFNKFLAIKQSVNGLDQLVLRDYDGNESAIDFPESVYTASFFNNPEFEQPHLRLHYESMITPDTVFDYQLSSKTLIERKVKAIPSGYDKSQYETKRLMIPARDGVRVPVSIMHKKGVKLDGSNPLHLYAYGAYGYGMSPSFASNRLSLVNRGVIYAIAHVRGGDEMGYQWYLDGKLKKRNNTFNDFIDVARGLIDKGYTQAGNISISGRSAGGELMGAVTIQAPELWSSVILGVPFVDVLNTMLDATLPLTPPEWEQWGNPIKDKAAFELIRSYSPYDNISATDYPAMLVTGGLNDPRVTYWEPAKWTAKMRHLKTDNNLLMMRMNMGAGHFSNSGRYGRLLDNAEEMTFTLLSHGISE